MLKIKVLGCYGLFPQINQPTSGYLFKNDNTNVLVDLGSGVFSKLIANVKPETLNAVILTHLHYDHISDIGVFNYYLESLSKKGQFNGKIDLYLPKVDNEIYCAISKLNFFNLIEISERKIEIGDLKVEFVKMQHPALCYGVIFEDNGQRLGYSGDSNLCVGLEKIIENCDLSICDAPLLYQIWDNSKPHCSAKIVGELANKYKNRVVISHIFHDSDLQKLNDEISFCKQYASIVQIDKEYF